MATYDIEACRSCTAPIIWAVTVNGRDMPVDAEPSPDGDIRLADRSHLHRKPLAEVLSVTQQFGLGNLRTSHFATCPHADQWRRPAAVRRSA